MQRRPLLAPALQLASRMERLLGFELQSMTVAGIPVIATYVELPTAERNPEEAVIQQSIFRRIDTSERPTALAEIMPAQQSTQQPRIQRNLLDHDLHQPVGHAEQYGQTAKQPGSGKAPVLVKYGSAASDVAFKLVDAREHTPAQGGNAGMYARVMESISQRRFLATNAPDAQGWLLRRFTPSGRFLRRGVDMAHAHAQVYVMATYWFVSTPMSRTPPREMNCDATVAILHQPGGNFPQILFEQLSQCDLLTAYFSTLVHLGPAKMVARDRLSDWGRSLL